MSRAARARATSSTSRRVTRSVTSTGSAHTKDPIIKKQEDEEPILKQEPETPEKPSRTTTSRKRTSSTSTPQKDSRNRKRVKREEEAEEQEENAATTGLISPSPSFADDSSTPKKPKSKRTNAASPSTLKDKKLKTYAQFTNKSPFPTFAHPTAAECKLAHRILTSLHGARTRPKEIVAPASRAGCGDSPSVLDSLVRTILSQNTSDTNSTRAKRSMDTVYGGSDNWSAIVAGGQAKLQESIKCGGLAAVKSKVILSILEQVHAKYGTYSLDHLHTASSEAAMTELLSFQGVGPKTASCVLLFCLQRESFAVDTHVWRITGLLGWRPPKASRDETHAHLDVMVPDEDKYGLHILLVTHGKRCDECRAGGKNLGKCELRKAFRRGLKEEGLEEGEGLKDEAEDEEE